MKLHKRGNTLEIWNLTKSETLDVLDVVTDHRIGSNPELKHFDHRDGMGTEMTLQFDSPMWAESFDRKIRRHDRLVVK